MSTTMQAAPAGADAQVAEPLVGVEALPSEPRSAEPRPVYAYEDPATRAHVARIMRRALARGRAS